MVLGFESFDLARHQTEARRVAFFGMIEQHLHADAHAEEGLFAADSRMADSKPLSRRYFMQSGIAPGWGKRRGPHCAHRLGLMKFSPVTSRDSRHHMLERLRHRAQIAHAVVDDDEGLGHALTKFMEQPRKANFTLQRNKPMARCFFALKTALPLRAARAKAHSSSTSVELAAKWGVSKFRSRCFAANSLILMPHCGMPLETHCLTKPRRNFPIREGMCQSGDLKATNLP